MKQEQMMPNGCRQVELDIAKIIAIFFMILSHCLMVTKGFDNTVSNAADMVIGHLLGCPCSAPVFMFCMGMGMIYSRKTTPGNFIKRGIKLMLLGIIVNVGEFFLPHFLSGYLLGMWDVFPIAGGLLLFCIDILAFAGMAFITIGIMKSLKLSNRTMLIAAIVLSVVGSLIRFTDTGSDITNLIAGYFFGSTGGFTAFPLFNWLIIVVAGYMFGQKYILCSDKEKLLRFWPICMIISIGYFIGSWFIPGGFLTDARHYYFMTSLDAVFCLMYTYGNIGLCLLISKHLSERVKRVIVRISKNVNEIYIIQWFLIPVTYIVIYCFNRVVFGDVSVVMISIAEMILSILLAEGICCIKRAHKC